jgi:hypothetical protein
MVSYQRNWQIKKIAQGLCKICGKEKIFKAQRCEKCYEKHLMYANGWKGIKWETQQKKKDKCHA